MTMVPNSQSDDKDLGVTGQWDTVAVILTCVQKLKFSQDTQLHYLKTLNEGKTGLGGG